MEYQFPKRLDHVMQLISQNISAQIIAGGTDLALKIKQKTAQPDLLVDITMVDELKQIKLNGHSLELGPCLTPADILIIKNIDGKIPLALYEASSKMGAPAVRNLATLGGNIGTSSPAGDLSTALLGLGAYVELYSVSGIRKIPLNDFFTGPGQNILKPGELITRIIIPPFLKSGFIKLGQRKSLSISIVVIAGSIFKKKDKKLGLRLALGAVAPTPKRAFQAEKIFETEDFYKEDLISLGEAASLESSPISDVRASGEYRKEMVRVLTVKLVSIMLDT